MKTSTFITASLCVALLAIGCGSKQKNETTTASGDSASSSKRERAPQVARTEPAKGAIREALLHLRRVHFALDKDSLMPASRDALTEAAQHLAANPGVHVYIDGHTDERGTTEYNLGLGDRRARTAANYLTKLGIAPERLHIVTFGKEQPMAAGKDDVSRAKNRRVEFRLMRGDVRLVLDEGQIYDDKGQDLASPAK